MSYFPDPPSLPLPDTAAPEYINLWVDNNTSQPSNTVAFDTGINKRDKSSCVVCNLRSTKRLQHCHIIPKSEPFTWDLMRQTSYIPSFAKSVEHESRNGVLMCSNHHIAFDAFDFYIRWDHKADEFIVINHSRDPELEIIHGNVLHFSTKMARCPFPTTFLFHEMRVRGHNPLQGDRDVTLQRGFRGLLGGSSGGGGGDGGRMNLGDGDGGGGGGGGTNGGAGEHGDGVGVQMHALEGKNGLATETFTPKPLVGATLGEWLQAARQHSSWTDCARENLSWDGTAEENAEKYRNVVLATRGRESPIISEEGRESNQ